MRDKIKVEALTICAVLMWIAFALNLPLLFAVGVTWFHWIVVPTMFVTAAWFTAAAIEEASKF